MKNFEVKLAIQAIQILYKNRNLDELTKEIGISTQTLIRYFKRGSKIHTKKTTKLKFQNWLLNMATNRTAKPT